MILKDKTTLADIAGQPVNLVEFSVSHYLLARALESGGAEQRAAELAGARHRGDLARDAVDRLAQYPCKPQAADGREDEAAALLSDLAGSPGLLLAISGGPDSTALLWLAARWRKKSKAKLTAVTVDHGLRKEAKREAAAVARLAKTAHAAKGANA